MCNIFVVLSALLIPLMGFGLDNEGMLLGDEGHDGNRRTSRYHTAVSDRFVFRLDARGGSCIAVEPFMMVDRRRPLEESLPKREERD